MKELILFPIVQTFANIIKRFFDAADDATGEHFESGKQMELYQSEMAFCKMPQIRFHSSKQTTRKPGSSRYAKDSVLGKRIPRVADEEGQMYQQFSDSAPKTFELRKPN
jgi:hypothetical protein